MKRLDLAFGMIALLSVSLEAAWLRAEVSCSVSTHHYDDINCDSVDTVCPQGNGTTLRCFDLTCYDYHNLETSRLVGCNEYEDFLGTRTSGDGDVCPPDLLLILNGADRMNAVTSGAVRK